MPTAEADGRQLQQPGHIPDNMAEHSSTDEVHAASILIPDAERAGISGPRGPMGVGDHTDDAGPSTTISSTLETVKILVPETLLNNVGSVDTRSDAAEHGTVNSLRKSTSIPVESAVNREMIMEVEQVTQVTEDMVDNNPVTIPDQLSSSSTQNGAVSIVDTEVIQVRPATELLGPGSIDSRTIHDTTPSPTSNSKKRRTSELLAGSTPLRQEILRSREKARRTVEHQPQGASGHRLSKRASSPDKIYVYIGVPPPAPVPASDPAPTPPPARTPSPELTPAERQESVLRGSAIVNSLAATYRAKIGALTRKYGIGPKELTAATELMKKQNQAKGISGLDWDVLDATLAAKYGR